MEIALQLDPFPLTCLQGVTALVTGAGGSIGSELCRHLAKAGVSSVVLADIHEFNLYSVDRKLREMGIRVEPLLVDIRHEHVVRHVFWKYRPDIVFHAAALKHVPLLQAHHNAIEAVRTNVFGTKMVVDEAGRCPSTKAVVMISTDKAVNPLSWMGLTKRCAEKIVHNQASRNRALKYIVVRFGNVMGSSGSVLPLFEEQIQLGGPVTVTDENMIRYMMSIEEAVGLVVKSAELGVRSDDNFGLFVLDMGKPVKILDVAKKMIAESGKDVPIEFIGIRPGEKFVEEMFYSHERPVRTEIGSIFRASAFLTTTLMDRKVEALLDAVDRRLSLDKIEEAMFAISPECEGKISL